MTIVRINRAPVMTLWAAVVAERLGYKRDEALTLGRAVAGLNANTKAKRLGLREPAAPGKDEKARKPTGRKDVVLLLGREVPVVQTADGLRAAKDGKPDAPEAVKRYLEAKFGDHFEEVRAAMRRLAAAHSREALAEVAMALYEGFRPRIPAGTRGWGAKGDLDLGALAKLVPGKSRRG